MSDNKVALIFFNIGFILMLISMVTGPFEIINWSLTTGVIACAFALAAIYLAFQNFDESDKTSRESTAATDNKKSV